jgi:hypothetical protein
MAVEFRGAPPHDLGTVEIATADVVDNGNVEVRLYLLDDWHRPINQVVRVQMDSSVARSLAERLTAAAAGEVALR